MSKSRGSLTAPIGLGCTLLGGVGGWNRAFLETRVSHISLGLL